MALHHKVIWSEGMFLRPQHFQQQERYLERALHLRTAPLQGLFWGYARLALDSDALALGKVALRAAQGVFPDGTAFEFDHPADAPLALEVPPGTRGQRVMLALARQREGTADAVYEAAHDALARHDVIEIELQDSTEGGLEPVLLQAGRPRLRLLLEHEAGDEWLTLGVARIAERRPDNRVVLDEAYIAPWLSAGAEPRLAGYVQELAGLLHARAQTLAARLAQPGRGGVAEVADFMLLSLVNRYAGSLWHAGQIEGLHPERLFHDWLMLACDLATYTSPQRRWTDPPAYAHDDLQASFGPLMDELRRSLSAVLEQNALQIPLEDRGRGVKVAQVADRELLRQAGFVLAVHAQMPGEALRAHFPAQVKIGPVERIRDLVHLQLPGVPVRALPVVPRQIPYHAGYVYFELDKHSELWRQLEQTGAMALHLAGEFPGLSMEFWAIRD
ncbi:type VI secretion system baseplate subunit TssK [Orrella sp. JC864]|uniref:type VI secretion system baseplate subunit TssK n=1 Tax=Orrella sp. JC864 TaxID=3120298 RepID=UPI0030087F9C